MSKVLIDTQVLQKLLVESAYYRILRENTSDDQWGDYFGELLSNYNASQDDYEEFLKISKDPINDYDWSFDDLLRWRADNSIAALQDKTLATWDKKISDTAEIFASKVTEYLEAFLDEPKNRYFM